MQKHYVVLENDDHLSDRLTKYLAEKKNTLLYMADQRDTEEILENFEKGDTLLFQPTLITWSQYNLLVMVMYSLIQENRLSIKEIEIFTHREESVAEELTSLWEGKRKYLDLVLQHVKVFTIDSGMDFQKTEIFI